KEWAESTGIRIVHIEEFFRLGPEAVMAEARRVVGDGPTYVSFDVDGLDPVYAPGTGTPEIGGFSTADAQHMIRALDGLALGGRAPQWQAGPTRRPGMATLLGPVDTSPETEDCLSLHVWTPSLDGAKRPVMVWLHGGAFHFGSANRAVTDGGNLARRGDVVVVSVNHRLNILGHFDLSGIGGERYGHSGNAGMLDLIAALGWVQGNIDRFGGDPGNI